ncbi:MAG TPA: anaerobic ribonucleoside triphosphate reductase [Candidatus Avichristensenella intestinipullorum]|uniref:Anaerobic ribonucleoside triphosphate reductase n=1 Tax=Candidatus Avichristensenella intestinipullorum TaxID=2840693 RepID=A0A9D0YVR7_9FIRM|nr:anaerobic ribonucleoside triphosphate reductase [Candidatus Avichristensenella intestinipullorum]
MIDTIIKRDGRTVPFHMEKIEEAVLKAFEASGSAKGRQAAHEIAAQVVDELARNESIGVPTVEQVQDTVEQALIRNGFVRTAKAYILYRAERSRVREMKGRLMQTLEDITFKDAYDCDIKRENANINGDTPMGVMLKYGSESAKQFYDMYVLNPQHARAHREGDIHIHDLDFLTLTTTCCQIDLLKLFNGGFSTGHGSLREPQNIASYAALCCIAIQSNQNDQHGGQSIVNFDYGMAPGVAKSFVKFYREDLSHALELLAGLEDADEVAARLIAQVREETGMVPTLEEAPAFTEALLPHVCALCGEDVARRALSFAQARAIGQTDHATYKAMVALVHNLNTMHSRAGAQIPFSSINYGMDTSPEGRMVVKNLLLATEAGMGQGETPIFPIQIFRVKEGVNYNPGDPNYDLFRLAIRCSAKRLFPNFSFLDAPFNARYYKGTPETEIAYMGCRTRVIGNVYDPSKEISNGRGNLSFTSINLPRIAIKAHHNAQFFFEELDRQMDLVFEQLDERFEIQAHKKVYNFPFLMGEGIWLDSEKLAWGDEIGEVLRHGTLTVGFIGLAEALTCLTGKHHGESEASQNLGLEIIGHMRQRCDARSEARKLNYTLIATPAEGLSGRFVRIDKEKYGVIPGVTDREYYTNSFHIPVYFPISAFDKIRLEAPYHALTNAGHITYVELDGDPLQNLDAFERVVRCMHDAGVGYGSINHPVDRDPVCGFHGIIGDTCPHCGRDESAQPFERIRRITGYLVGTLDRFNNAKRAEERDRVKHGV